MCDPPSEKGREVKIFQIDFDSRYDSRVLSVSITKIIFEKYL